MFAGHATVGACVSLMVTVNVHDPVFAEASVAVHVTVVTPIGNVDPDAGTHTTVAPGQLSTAAGVVKVATPEHWPAVFGCVMFAGHVTVGACVSLTVTVKEHVEFGGTEFAAVHVTVVVPITNVDPEAGTHVTVGTGHPVAVGVANVTAAPHTPVVLLTVMFAGHAPITGGIGIVVIVGSAAPATAGSSVSTFAKFEPEIVPWFDTVHTPTGNGVSIVTRNVTVTVLPAGTVPMFFTIVAPERSSSSFAPPFATLPE